jgi:hypothetical protein
VPAFIDEVIPRIREYMPELISTRDMKEKWREPDTEKSS